VRIWTKCAFFRSALALALSCAFVSGLPSLLEVEVPVAGELQDGVLLVELEVETPAWCLFVAAAPTLVAVFDGVAIKQC
jgi:hypothetical protein